MHDFLRLTQQTSCTANNTEVLRAGFFTVMSAVSTGLDGAPQVPFGSLSPKNLFGVKMLECVFHQSVSFPLLGETNSCLKSM